MMTPWPPAPVVGPPIAADHQTSGSPSSETSTSNRAPYVRPTSVRETKVAAAVAAAVARPLATAPVGNAIARKSRVAAMRLSQRSSRGVLARRALTLSMISCAKSARLVMAVSYSWVASRKLTPPREARRSELLTKSTCCTTTPSEALSSSLLCFTFAECAYRYSKARTGLPTESRVESRREMFFSLRSFSRRSIELINSVISTSSSHGKLFTA
mmetsp:Transcript_7775/g.20457  ORF Transcript_7775/g.20457 Transcript_7775/m.20457 type:complete len:214 (-) Transcript_7775:1156-1797(-)